MSDDTLKRKTERKMLYRLNRSEKLQKDTKYVPIFGISGLAVVFVIVIIIGSVPTLKEAANTAADTLTGEDQVKGDYKSDITLTTIDGKKIDLSDYQGKVVIVYFFGTHCPGCPDQADILADIDDAYSSDKVFIVPICLDSEADTSDSALRAFLDERQSSWPAIRDTPQYEYATFFEIQYKPTVKILDKDGNVEATMVGTTQGSYNNIKNEINSLL